MKEIEERQIQSHWQHKLTSFAHEKENCVRSYPMENDAGDQ